MDGVTIETCAECGFDARAWTPNDAASLLDGLGQWWELGPSNLPATVLNERPAPEVWSALEYGRHTAQVITLLGWAIEQLLCEDGAALPAAPTAEPPVGSATTLAPTAVITDVDDAGHSLAALTRAAAPDEWAHRGRAGDQAIEAGALLRHAVHDASHHLMDIGRGLASLSAGPPRRVGSVLQINASDGGVPKRAVDRGSVGWTGLAGDHQADRRHHGRPFQALCLWSREVIDELVGDGHPIAPGCAGENLTLSGVDWAALGAGTRLRIGDALAEVSFPATPCAKQKRWFSDGDFARIDYARNPRLVRWYAWVRAPGEVRPGAPVVVQPGD
ncbi:MAG TPA: MOSC domain-containing protein [Acidimicrobiia bacterium]|nr:MOSC domain-containing protein [Acidimicrobiia bacterium]